MVWLGSIWIPRWSSSRLAFFETFRPRMKLLSGVALPPLGLPITKGILVVHCWRTKTRKSCLLR